LILAILTDLKVDLFFEFTIQNIIYNIKSELFTIFYTRISFQNFNRINILKLVFYHDKVLRLLIGIRILVGSGLILASLISNFSSEHLEIQKLEFG
jgi:hypothetical protein